jgi:hypothetical protein
MSAIEDNRLYNQFLQWLEGNVTPDQNGKRKVSESELWTFLNAHVFSDTTTITVDGAEISLLWSYLIGPVQPLWDNNSLSEDLADRANRKIRYVGNTLAGEFLAYLEELGSEDFLAFRPELRIPIEGNDDFPGVTVTVAITPKLHQTQLCLGGRRTVDVEALGAVPAGHSIVALSIRCQNGRTGLIGDERVTSHLLSPPPLEPDQRVQGKVRRP